MNNKFKESKSTKNFLDILHNELIAQYKHIDDVGLKKHIIAYIDILGIKKLMLNNNMVNYAESAYATFNLIKNIMLEYNYKCSIISDSIVISIEIDKLDNIKMFLDRCKATFMALLDPNFSLLSRGAITIGDLYHNNDIVFGSGLVEAYLLQENEKYPRYIFTDNVSKNINDFYSQPQFRQYYNLDFILENDKPIALNILPYQFLYYESLDIRLFLEEKGININNLNMVEDALKYYMPFTNSVKIFNDTKRMIIDNINYYKKLLINKSHKNDRKENKKILEKYECFKRDFNYSINSLIEYYKKLNVQNLNSISDLKIID